MQSFGPAHKEEGLAFNLLFLARRYQAFACYVPNKI